MTPRKWKIEIKSNKWLSYWWWELKASNGRILAESSTYGTPDKCRRTANKVAKRLKVKVYED